MKNTPNYQGEPYTVCALYQFVSLPEYQAWRAPLVQQLKTYQLVGTLLLAAEGINGTIAGADEAIVAFLQWLQNEAIFDDCFVDLDCKFSYSQQRPFHRTKVKLKQEIVTMGLPNIDPNKVVGTYVEAEDWNELISDPDTLLIDTRNHYEVQIGSFSNAINPNTETFREFPDYVKSNLDPNKQQKVAMFCTGGIRCEKASAFMKQQGFEQVFHLKGGILRYLEKVEAAQSLWQGECFVFDDRVAVNHDLAQGQYDQCHACRHPLTADDKKSQFYIAGVSCQRCYAKLTEEQKQRFSEREKQVQLAKQRGETHIGSDSQLAATQHRADKHWRKQQQRNKPNNEY